ncbi:MAG: chlorophyll synthesis pathway protein BchC [Rhizobacter sp.]|nr:chlorophyll synthesis pathway protein BchC [Chlorobiales bacterium]
MKVSKAVVFERAGEIKLREVTLREMHADDVLVETYWSSISAGTEKMLLSGKLPPMPMTQFPVVPGYETVGKIIAAGANVPENHLGKFVYVSGSLGYSDVNAAFGGASQYLVSPVHKTTDLSMLPDVSVGLALPLAATALHATDLAQVSGKKVLVLGQGAVGILVAEFARLFGATKIVATDKVISRLQKSSADVVIDAGRAPLNAATQPAEFDAVIDCSGAMQAVDESLNFLMMRGAVVLAGYYERIDLSYAQAFMKEIKFHVAKQWALGDLERVRELMRTKALDFKKIFTHEKALDETEQAYRTAFENPDCLKMILSWQKD